MGFFNKNKKNTKNEAAPCEKVRPSNENVVYRDGVFEAFEDTDTGKKYGRILKFDGNDKVFEMPDEEFALWQDASQNYGKYRITYERDEDFFIEKALIEKADAEPSPKKESPSPEIPAVSADDIKNELAPHVAFYNSAINSDDGGKSLFASADAQSALICAALCEKKIAELAEKAKQEAPAGEKATVRLPVTLDNVCKNAKGALFEKIARANSLYVIYSEHTKRPHLASGFVLVALTKDVADKLESDFKAKNIAVRTVEFASTPDTTVPGPSSRIANEAVLCGFRGIRFVEKYGLSCHLMLNSEQVMKDYPFPENTRLCAAMTAFFQDLRNGIPAEKLRTSELSMYDALFRSTLLQPCMKKDPEKSGELSVSIASGDNGLLLHELFTSVNIMERSEIYNRFKSEAPASSGYKKWTFDELLSEITSKNTLINGFIIDKEFIPVPFTGPTLDKILKLKEIWEKNGKTFDNR